jgi:predicted transcriptional regulator of viral defense system
MGVRVTVEQAIQALGRPIFTTREIAAVRKGTLSATSQVLTRMARQRLLVKAARGIWCIHTDPRFSRFGLVPYLAGNNRAYVSLLSALNLHGLINQIPQVIYAVSTGPTRLVRTAVGSFSFHQIQPGFFDGFDWNGPSRSFLLATPEKAIVDSFYLSTRKGNRFRYLPELDVTDGPVVDAINHWIDRIQDPLIRKSVKKKAEGLHFTG